LALRIISRKQTEFLREKITQLEMTPKPANQSKFYIVILRSSLKKHI